MLPVVCSGNPYVVDISGVHEVDSSAAGYATADVARHAAGRNLVAVIVVRGGGIPFTNRF